MALGKHTVGCTSRLLYLAEVLLGSILAELLPPMCYGSLYPHFPLHFPNRRAQCTGLNTQSLRL